MYLVNVRGGTVDHRMSLHVYARLNACMSVSKAHGKTSQTSYFFKLIHYEVTLWQEKSLQETFINYVIQNCIEQFRFGGEKRKDKHKNQFDV